MEFKFLYSAAVKAENNITVPVIYKFIKTFIHNLPLNESIAAEFFNATVYLS